MMMDYLNLLEKCLMISLVSEEASVSQPCKTRTYIINYAHVYSVKASAIEV